MLLQGFVSLYSARGSHRSLGRENVIEILVIGLMATAAVWSMRRRRSRRRHRLDAAYERARQVRLAGIGPQGAVRAIYTERFFNPN